MTTNKDEWLKKGTLIVLFLGLSAYSIGLVAIDVFKGREASRGFFSDIIAGIDYPLPDKGLYGLNTSLCVITLSGTALLYALSAAAPGGTRRDRWFQVSQTGFFIYLAADDRLRIHEKLGVLFGVEDAFLLLALGVLQVAILFWLGRIHQQLWRLRGCLLAAGGLFFIMVMIDAFMPRDMRGRLALEDLSKLWAIVFLFLYAWRYTLATVSGTAIMKGSNDD